MFHIASLGFRLLQQQPQHEPSPKKLKGLGKSPGGIADPPAKLIAPAHITHSQTYPSSLTRHAPNCRKGQLKIRIQNEATKKG
jgi:hypothetical protein